MSKALLGIDLGTSSIKVLLRHGDGRIEKAKATYDEISPSGWLHAMKTALRMLDLTAVAAVSLSSQTGTYVVNGRDVITWSDPAGKEELPRIRGAFSADTFLSEIGMPHPAITSYPLPRLLYIKEHFEGVDLMKPQGTYMLFIDCGKWCAAHGKDVGDVLKAGWDVGVVWQDGRAFHGQTHIRLNLALPLSRVQEAFDRLDKYVFNA